MSVTGKANGWRHRKADCGTDPQRAAAGVRHGGNQTAEYVGRDRGIDRTYVETGRRKQRL